MRTFTYILLILLVAAATGPLYVGTMPSLVYGTVSNEGADEVSMVKTALATSTTILFTGDVMLARRVETIMDKNGASFVLKRMPPLHSLANAVVVNFEASIPAQHVHTPDLTFRFSVDAPYAAFLKTAGVTHAGLANNHAYDTGKAGFAHTYDVLTNERLIPFGDTKVATSSYVRIEQDAVSVGLFGLYAVNTYPDMAALKVLLTQASTTDAQIAYIHWGNEYSLNHSKEQQDLAHALIDAGFDAIVGHHPHVVQDVGWYNGVPIFYSLGNFIFDQYFSRDVQEGLLVSLEVTKEQLRFTLLPHTTIDARTQPRLLEGGEKDVFLQSLAKRSDSLLSGQVLAGEVVSVLLGCNSCTID